MDIRMDRRGFIGVAGAATAAAALGGPARAAAPLKVGFVFTGPIGDGGYTFQHNLGRLAVDKELGAAVKTSFVENVAEGPDAERVIRQLAQAGNDLIFTTSFGFMDSTVKVAKQFPKTHFEHATGYKRAPNLATYNARFYQGRQVQGQIAAMLSKKGEAGYIASFPIPEVVMGINAFTLAARKVNPKFVTKVIWVNTWYDPAKEADSAKALMDQGCDIMCQHTDSVAPLQAAQTRGVVGFGQSSDMSKAAPKACLTSTVDSWGPYYVRRVKEQIAGKWASADTWGGMAAGMVTMGAYGPGMTPEAKAAADKVIAQIKAHKLPAMIGPVKDQKGVVKIAAGSNAADKDLLGMNWYVEGVQG